ncbi:hypothetical protein [Bradyrhizobium sp. CB2312]|uniref:hypothetical protein n=1 Tax=Bradyrhizobium sp. CB2312 TaxID=3039155 RepID=UPI0024B13D93|nr:hypothetical protein [Bradyrhizobium sp. CB2312]WFU69253.1 hypothetical protein QA642_28675 [Bradyrhizobium sp. CB2312]
MIEDLLSGQYGQVLRVVAFNAVESWSRDASEDIAVEIEGEWRLKVATSPMV